MDTIIFAVSILLFILGVGADHGPHHSSWKNPDSGEISRDVITIVVVLFALVIIIYFLRLCYVEWRRRRLVAEVIAHLPEHVFIDADPSIEPTCAVCQEDYQEATVSTLSCGHTFHRDCIRQCIRTRFPGIMCPVCRVKIEPTSTASSTTPGGNV